MPSALKLTSITPGNIFNTLNQVENPSGIRPTLLIFTADDSIAKDSAADTIEFFGDAADYLLIDNSARFKSDSFKATPLYEKIIAETNGLSMAADILERAFGLTKQTRRSADNK